MNLRVLGSSSNGNGYILTDADGRSLIMELGVKPAVYKQALRYDLSGVEGILVSHEHGDHAKYVRDFLHLGKFIVAPKEVFAQVGSSPFAKVASHNSGFILGPYKVVAFEVQHDVPCLGYLISHPEQRILFLTDTASVNYSLPPNINTFLIEANYKADVLQYNIEHGLIHSAQGHRLLTAHCELQTTKTILLSQDLSHANHIVLLHLSSRNSDPDSFATEIECATSIPTVVAKPNLTLGL